MPIPNTVDCFQNRPFRLRRGSPVVRALTWFTTALACTSAAVAAPHLKVTPDHRDGIYRTGETITWNVALQDDSAGAVSGAHYVLKLGGGKVLREGDIAFDAGRATITYSMADPGTVLADVAMAGAAENAPHALAGAAVSPERIPLSAPCPQDFDTFWQAKLAELAAVAPQPVLKPEDSGRAGVDYWKVTLANIRGTHIQAQLARPASEGKYPALVLFQYAGVYPLKKEWATDAAARGWLVLNVNAHDLPIDDPAAFYQQLAAGPLKDYPSIGHDDREKSYFLRMFLGCYRAVEYVASRPDWDGRTLVVSGTSQGGLQSFVAAALDPKVTGLTVLVPAGLDASGDLLGRRPGWPYWMAHTRGEEEKVRQTAQYFDGANFAARVKCPALVGVGLIDVTAPPSGVFAGFNQLKGPKEILVMPDSNHHGDGHAQAPYQARLEALRDAWVHHTPDPLLRDR